MAGPNGVQRRLNSGPLFDWEAPAPAQESAAPQIEPPSGRPSAAPKAEAPASARWARHDDPEKRFDYPVGWQPVTRGSSNAYVAPRGDAVITYSAPFKMGRDAKVADFMGQAISAIAADNRYELGPHESGTVNGFPAEVQALAVKGEAPLIVLILTVQRGGYVHVFSVAATPGGFQRYESEIGHVIGSYLPKTA